MYDKQPPGLPDDEATKFESDFKKAMADVERVKERLAKEQPKVEPRRSSETVRKGNTAAVRTEDSSEQRVIKSETAGEFVDEIKALNSEIKNWRTESGQDTLKKSKGDRWERAMATLAVSIAIVFGTIGLWVNTNRQAEKVGNKLKESQFVVTSPPEGADVGLGQRVFGKTPYPQLNHYVAVTIIRTGSTYIRPAFVSPDGTFSGEARFGDAAVGEDDEFTIRALATKASLATGNLTEVPDDAVWSDFVTVRRVQSSPVAGTQIVLTTPTDGAEVGADSTISGKTSLPDLNHYIIVTPTRIGTSFVQNQPALVNRADGSLTWRATFGGAQVGVGE